MSGLTRIACIGNDQGWHSRGICPNKQIVLRLILNNIYDAVKASEGFQTFMNCIVLLIGHIKKT